VDEAKTTSFSLGLGYLRLCHPMVLCLQSTLAKNAKLCLKRGQTSFTQYLALFVVMKALYSKNKPQSTIGYVRCFMVFSICKEVGNVAFVQKKIRNLHTLRVIRFPIFFVLSLDASNFSGAAFRFPLAALWLFLL